LTFSKKPLEASGSTPPDDWDSFGECRKVIGDETALWIFGFFHVDGFGSGVLNAAISVIMDLGELYP